MRKERKMILLIVVLALFVCMQNTAGKPIDSTMGKTVMAHYQKSGDKQKLAGARFLLENMEYHSFKASHVLDKYYAEIEQINKKYKFPACAEQYNKLFAELGSPKQTVTIQKDENAITAEELISNIDMAFDDWRNGLWARHLSFDEVCEYLLPYRVFDEALTTGWREKIRDKYLKNANSILTSDDIKMSAYWACCKVNDALRTLKFQNMKVLPNLNIEWPLSALMDIRMGECFDYAVLTTYVMRACGIPVSFDYTPQWPDRAHNHYWNCLYDNTKQKVSFMGVESNPGYPSKHGRFLAKVFRRMFAYQPNSLFALNTEYKERVPDVLNSPFIKDVSDEYFEGRSLTVKLNGARKDNKFAYLAVFNNSEWIPIDYAQINEAQTATFNKLGSDIVYLPVYWGRAGSIPAGNPILLSLGNTPKELKPDTLHTQTIVLNRKYPHFNRIVKFRGLMKNGYFEASNNADFSDAVKCVVIKKTPLIGYDTLDLKGISKRYRYWRFVSQKGGKCNVAEINFIKGYENIKPVKVLHEGNSLDNTVAENAFDGDALTYYISATTSNAWVGVDMGRPVVVDKIVYKPRNDDNDIVKGHQYELMYFVDGVEQSVGITIANSGELVFKNVPKNALYILHDHNGGTEERVFTYNNNKITWY